MIGSVSGTARRPTNARRRLAGVVTSNRKRRLRPGRGEPADGRQVARGQLRKRDDADQQRAAVLERDHRLRPEVQRRHDTKQPNPIAEVAAHGDREPRDIIGRLLSDPLRGLPARPAVCAPTGLPSPQSHACPTAAGFALRSRGRRRRCLGFRGTARRPHRPERAPDHEHGGIGPVGCHHLRSQAREDATSEAPGTPRDTR